MSQAPVDKKAKLRYYNDVFIMFGLVSVDAKPMWLECGVMLTNDSMKKVKLLHHQKFKHPSSIGKDRECFERKKKRQSVNLFDFVNNSANAKTLTPSYLVFEILAKVEAPQVYGEKLIKPAMLAYASEVLGKYAASALSKISFSNDTITRRQDEMASYAKRKMVEILRKTKISL